MELLDKVRLIIGHKCESPSQFADEIDIPRSAVSHLLNGRNKPSLDVVRKIIKRYPDLGTEWIWDDNKMPELDASLTDWKPEKELLEAPKDNTIRKPLDLFSHARDEQDTVHKNVKTIKTDAKKVVRVLLFFSDGSFEEFL